MLPAHITFLVHSFHPIYINLHHIFLYLHILLDPIFLIHSNSLSSCLSSSYVPHNFIHSSPSWSTTTMPYISKIIFSCIPVSTLFLLFCDSFILNFTFTYSRIILSIPLTFGIPYPFTPPTPFLGAHPHSLCHPPPLITHHIRDNEVSADPSFNPSEAGLHAV